MATSFNVTSRSVPFPVAQCPIDGKPHDYLLDVHVKYDPSILEERLEDFETRMADLAGTASPVPWKGTVDLICPNTKKRFSEEVSITPEPGENIDGVAMHVSSPPGGPASPDISLSLDKFVADELGSWFKS